MIGGMPANIPRPVMPGRDPGIHGLPPVQTTDFSAGEAAWMTGSSPVMTIRRVIHVAAYIIVLAAICLVPPPAHAGRLEQIKARGYLGCGVHSSVAGFATVKDGHYSGFDTDICRAVA